MYQAFIWFFSLLVDFLRSLSVSIASSQQNIIKMKFIINASNIPYYFEQAFQLICFFAYIH